MRLSSYKYIVRDAFRSIWRNRFMSLASLITVAISLIILGFAWMIVINADYFTNALESELEISVYLRTDIAQDRIIELKQTLTTMQDVESVVFISKSHGLELLGARFGDNISLIDSLEGDNPLPDMYSIKVKHAETIPVLAPYIQGLAGVESVRYGQGMVENLLKVTAWLRLVGFCIVAATAAAALFFISTTIRITVFSRREEIAIMQLVGATNWYIRWPFFLEGMMIGLAGALIAVVGLALFYTNAADYITENLNFIPLITDHLVMLSVYRNLLIFGTCLGAIGSALIMRRFLKI